MGRRFRLSDPRKNEERKEKTGPSCIISTCNASGEYATWHFTVIAPTNSFRTDSHDTFMVDILTSIFLSKWTVLSVVQLGLRLSKIPLPPLWVLTSSSPLGLGLGLGLIGGFLCAGLPQRSQGAGSMSHPHPSKEPHPKSWVP